MLIEDLGTMRYREAWAVQERIHEQVLAGGEEHLLLVEHPPVITLGRRRGLAKNILASADELQVRGVEVVESDRGGDVTFHGPGQLVCYPIIRLNDHRLSVGGYVRRLQQIVIDTLNDLDVPSQLDPTAIGVWTCDNECELAKVCAFGVRIRRGVSMHGLALDVSTDLTFFDLINPCGLNRPVTSLQKLLAPRSVTMDCVKQHLTERARQAFCIVGDSARAH